MYFIMLLFFVYATLSQLLTAIFTSSGPIQAPIETCVPCSCPEEIKVGFADDLQRLNIALQALPLDYILCVLL